MTSESQNIEWKQSWHDDYLKWICGFANAQGNRLQELLEAQKRNKKNDYLFIIN